MVLFMNKDKKLDIEIYDNLFSYNYMSKLYDMVINSNYHIGWADTKIIENRDKVFMFSLWELTDFMKSEFLSNIKDESLLERIGNRLPSRCVINCGNFSDTYLPHTHNNKEVLLYYVNLDWKLEWNGETAFYSDDLKEIILTNPYVPGRMVWFDGEIPHSIKPQTHLGPKFRFTISLFFDTNYIFA